MFAYGDIGLFMKKILLHTVDPKKSLNTYVR